MHQLLSVNENLDDFITKKLTVTFKSHNRANSLLRSAKYSNKDFMIVTKTGISFDNGRPTVLLT